MRNLCYLLLLLTVLSSCGDTEEPKTETNTEQTPAKQNEVQATETAKPGFGSRDDSILNVLNEKIRANINNKDLYLERAEFFSKRSFGKEAMQDINRAFRLDTLYLPTLLAQADFLTKSGKLEVSLQILDKANFLYPENSDVHVEYSKLYLIARSNEKSLGYADLAIKYNIYNAEAYYLKGYNFLEMGDTTTAISSYRTAIEQKPDYFEVYLELGLIFSEKNDPIALEYFRNALEIKPYEKRALYSKGMYEQEHELFNEALETYTNAVKIHPDFKEAYYNMGYVHLFYLKLYRQSQTYFTNAIEIDPRYIEAYYNRGYAFELLGDVNNAAKDYRKALSINPSCDLAAKGLSRLN